MSNISMSIGEPRNIGGVAPLTVYPWGEAYPNTLPVYQDWRELMKPAGPMISGWATSNIGIKEDFMKEKETLAYIKALLEVMLEMEDSKGARLQELAKKALDKINESN